MSPLSPRRFFALAVCALFPAFARAQLPTLADPSLSITRVVGNLDAPTGIAFMPNSNNAFVIEKDTGRVKVLEGNKVSATALDLNVDPTSERGLLGIALHPGFSTNGLVYLYYSNLGPDENRIASFKYDAGTKKLALQRVIKSLPLQPGPNHDGGKIAFGPDKKLYAVIGDLNRRERTTNNEDSTVIGRNTAILRLNAKNGSSPKDNPFYNVNNTGNKAALNDIYAYGVRNSFGLNFDPSTGHLWDTENGPSQFDEINRVRRGMNSGWTDIMGPKALAGTGVKLVSLGKAARYRDPLFSWENPVGVTDINFPMGTIGKSYRKSIIVGDNNTGRLYRFRLNDDRTDIDRSALTAQLSDRVTNFGDDDSSLVFGQDFGVVTDIERGPGGLYLTTFDPLSGVGDVFRIRRTPGAIADLRTTAVPEPGVATAFLVAGLALARRRKR
jgi:aldose sugar dehydrogenase